MNWRSISEARHPGRYFSKNNEKRFKALFLSTQVAQERFAKVYRIYRFAAWRNQSGEIALKFMVFLSGSSKYVVIVL